MKTETAKLLERIDHALYTTGMDSVACFSIKEMRLIKNCILDAERHKAMREVSHVR